VNLPAPGRRRSPAWRPSLLVCGLIAVALHLLLLLWPLRPREPAVASTAAKSLRVLRLDNALPTTTTTTTAAAAPKTAAEPQPPATTSPAAPSPPASAAVPVVAAPVAAESAAPAAEPEWWPREQLDSGPQPRQPVLVDTARAGGVLPAGSNALLYVDEQGRVERVEFGGTPLPAPAEQALRAAFEATPFEPGQRGGKPVRAKVRVAVDLVLEPEEPAR
jgi:hypothetical protein